MISGESIIIQKQFCYSVELKQIKNDFHFLTICQLYFQTLVYYCMN